jgi:hypothetical protein
VISIKLYNRISSSDLWDLGVMGSGRGREVRVRR